MLEKHFKEVYLKFKITFYKKVFSTFEVREASLTTIETFCAEVIHALGSPTINEFAQFANISAQNATHRVNSLVRKGYINKVQSPDDRREYRLVPAERFYAYYNMSGSYMHDVLRRVQARFSAEELTVFERVLEVMNAELMPEVDIGADEL